MSAFNESGSSDLAIYFGDFLSTIAAFTMPAMADSVLVARQQVTAFLSNEGSIDLEHAIAVTSELVANSVVHAATELQVVLERWQYMVKVVVEDFDNQLKNFIKIFPKDYKKVLQKQSEKVKNELAEKKPDNALDQMANELGQQFLQPDFINNLVNNSLSCDNYLFFSLPRMTVMSKTKIIGIGIAGNVIWFDEDADLCNQDQLPVNDPKILSSFKFNKIFIASLNPIYIDRIQHELLTLGYTNNNIFKFEKTNQYDDLILKFNIDPQTFKIINQD